jgi:hypothetical protein
MSDGDDNHAMSLIVDFIDDSVGTPSGRPETLQFKPQRLTQSPRVSGDCREGLDDRCGRSLRKLVEAPRSGTGDDETPGSV